MFQLITNGNIQVAEDFSSPMECLRPFLSICWSFAFIGVFCEFGEIVTDQFETFNDELGQSRWYLYPIEVQQTLLILMANAQRTTFVQGFGNIICARETFKVVMIRFHKNIVFTLSQVNCSSFSDN